MPQVEPESVQLNYNRDSFSVGRTRSPFSNHLVDAPSRHWRNWHFVSFLVALNQSSMTTPQLFATSLLDPQAGYYGGAALYMCQMLASLFLSVPLLSVFGLRGSITVGMCLCCAYLGCFTVACSPLCPMGSHEQWVMYISGACIGGTGSGIMWTAQGTYLTRSVARMAELSSKPLEVCSSEHARVFAIHYLLVETVFKLFAAISLQHHVPIVPVLAGMFVLTLGACLGMGAAQPLGSPPRGCYCSAAKFVAAVSLWSDGKLWCLSLTNLTFGFAAAYMNGYVNLNFTDKQLGKAYVGYFGMLTALVAGTLSHLFGIGARSLGKGVFVFFGSMCFLAVPALVLLGHPGDWGVWLVVLYVFQGSGRAVYESTNKAVFADFFQGENTEGAFANVMIQNSLAFIGCFIFSATLPKVALAGAVFVLALVTFPCYMLARVLRRRSGEAVIS